MNLLFFFLLKTLQIEKKVLFILSIIIFNFAFIAKSFSQRERFITLELLGNYHDRLHIDRNYEILPNSSDVASKSSLGYEARLAYGFAVTKKIYAEVGFHYGIQPYQLKLAFFNIDNMNGLNLFQNYKEYSLNYYGGNIDLEYRHEFGAKGKFAIGYKLGGAIVYHTPWFLTFSINWMTSSGNDLRLFYSEMQVNENNDLLLGLTGGINLRYKINEKVFLKFGVNLFYSSKMIMNTTDQFILRDGNVVHRGSYNTRFMYGGFSVGANYLLN